MWFISPGWRDPRSCQGSFVCAVQRAVPRRNCGDADAAQEMGKTSTNYFAVTLKILALLLLDYLTVLVSPVKMCLKALGRNLVLINTIPESQTKAGR